MGSYEQPKAYFTLADASASRNSRLSGASAASDFRTYMSQKANTIRSVKKAKEDKLAARQGGFYEEYQTAFQHLSKLESALTGYDGRHKGDESGAEEITAFKAQIQLQLERIAGDLTKKLNSPEGEDMTEGQIQALLGTSIGRVQKLQSTIVNVMSAAEEYYNADEDSILASSNPELQLFFDGLKDEAIDMIFSETENGEWVVFPVSTKDSRTANKLVYVDANKDGKIDEEEKRAQAENWANNPDNKLYRKEGGVTEYNYIKDIGPLNLSQLERDYKNGTNGPKGQFQGNKDGAFFNSIGNYKTLSNDFDTRFKQFIQDNSQALQAISPTETGLNYSMEKKKLDDELQNNTITKADYDKKIKALNANRVVKSKNQSADPTATGKKAKNIKADQQNYYNSNQIEDLLKNNPIGQEFLQQFVESETLNSDLTGWLGEDIDMLGDKYNTKELRQNALKDILINHALKTIPGGQPMENPDDVTNTTTTIDY